MNSAALKQLTDFANANPAIDARIQKNIKRSNYQTAAMMVADYYKRLAQAYKRRAKD